MGNTVQINSPGHLGSFAFEDDQNTVPDTSTGQAQADIFQEVTVVPGLDYTLTFWAYFNRGDNGFIGVMLNGAAVYTVDALDAPGTGVWKVNNINFTATTTNLEVRFQFLYGGEGGQADLIDDVSITSRCNPGNGIVQNGGFECGIAYWQTFATTGNTFQISSPGHTGSSAFEDRQNSLPADSGQAQAHILQVVTVVPEQSYTLRFWTFFNPSDNNGFIGVMLNGNPVATVDPFDAPGVGVWKDRNITFTAASASLEVKFEFLYGGSVVQVDRIDDVSIIPS